MRFIVMRAAFSVPGLAASSGSEDVAPIFSVDEMPASAVLPIVSVPVPFTMLTTPPFRMFSVPVPRVVRVMLPLVFIETRHPGQW